MSILGYDDDEFKKSTGTIFAVIFVIGFAQLIPILGLLAGLIRLVPTFKEIILGAAVVAVFTDFEEIDEGVKFALVTGMIAAIAFNILYIPGFTILSGARAAAMSTTENAAMGGGIVGGLAALSNLIGLLLFSPIGYAIGGALGTVAND